MQRSAIKKKRLSIFTYFLVFCIVSTISLLTFKEIGFLDGFEEILYQKNTQSSVVQENKYYIKKIYEEYGISVDYGDSEKNLTQSIDANAQYDDNIVNNNLKIIYEALKKYPSDVFDIFKEEKYSLSIIIVSDFNDNNIALASRNTLNQYRIFLSNTEDFERSFHHEFFHVLEYYMSDKVKYLYYAWNSYLPSNFEYEEDTSKLTDEYVYVDNGTDTQNQNVYFLTKYSKVSAKEDRAEIFAELMMLTKKESYLKEGTNLRQKINYLMSEIYENISISEFYFTDYLN